MNQAPIVEYLDYEPQTDMARSMLRDLTKFNELNDLVSLPPIKTAFELIDGEFRRQFLVDAGLMVVGCVVGAEVTYPSKRRRTYMTEHWQQSKGEIVRFYKSSDLRVSSDAVHDSQSPDTIVVRPKKELAETTRAAQHFASTRLVARQYVKLIRTEEEFRDMLGLYAITNLKEAICSIARTSTGRIPDNAPTMGLELDFARAVAGEPAIKILNDQAVFNADAFEQPMPMESYVALVGEMSRDSRYDRIMEWVTKMPFAELRSYQLHEKKCGMSENDRELMVDRAITQIKAQHELGVLDYGQLLDAELLVHYPVLAVIAHDVFYNNKNTAYYCAENDIKPLQTTQRYLYEILRNIASDDERYGKNAQAVLKALVPDIRKDTVHLANVVGLANSIARSTGSNKKYYFESIDDLADVSDALQAVLEITRSSVPIIAENQAYTDRMHTDLVEALLSTAQLAQQLRNTR